ncbi:MAG: hypothetical protein MNPFHGCM_00420 [Gemmatimonadaceae bacterium]|nr:hypothetical protein [Gemmatimonadaceae bacterium]
MIVVLEGQRAVGLKTLRQVWVAAGNEHEVAGERAVPPDRTGAIHSRMETMIRAEHGQRGTGAQQLRGGTRRKELSRVLGEDHPISVGIVELDTPERAFELGPTRYSLYARCEGAVLLGTTARSGHHGESKDSDDSVTFRHVHWRGGKVQPRMRQLPGWRKVALGTSDCILANDRHDRTGSTGHPARINLSLRATPQRPAPSVRAANARADPARSGSRSPSRARSAYRMERTRETGRSGSRVRPT